MPIMLAFAFIAIALITPALIYGIQQNNQMMIGLVAARQMRDVTHAAKGYITMYAATIEGTATATTPATITVPMLVNTGFLPAGFGQTNPYQQTWEVQVLQPSPGDLQALVLSQGGVPIQPAEAPRIGAEEGGSGGSVQANGTAQGSFGSWQVSLTDYTDPGAGHVASLIDYSNGQMQSDYLYRTAVPGNPQVNTMQTNLNTGGNAVTNTGTVQFTTNPASGVIYQGEACSQTGAIGTSSNGSGQLMVCQGGVWRSAGGNPWADYNGQSAAWYDPSFPGGSFYISQTVNNGTPYVTLSDSCGTWSGPWGVGGAVYEPGGLEGGSYDGYNGCQPAAVKATLSGVVASSMFSWRTRSTGGNFPGFDIFIPWQGQPGGWVLYP